MPDFLIAGLGNPGPSYRGTRHNAGFELLDSFATKYRTVLQEKKKLCGFVGKTTFDEGMVLILLKPTTFMNLSGSAVKKCADFYKIPSSQILILVDDIDLPLGEIRLKTDSGSGTHNGLKSIEHHLQTKEYARLRIGVGNHGSQNLEEYVLQKFLPEEKVFIERALSKGVRAIEIFLKEGVTRAMNFANTRVKQSEGEKK